MRRDARNWTPENPPPLVRPGEKTLFTPVPDWLAERRELSWPAKMLYARLVRYAGRKIAARPTQARLARDLGAPRRTLERWLAELRAEHDGMPLIWIIQQGVGAARYYFAAHPWRRERVLATAPPFLAERSGGAPPKMAERSGRAYKERACASGDNEKRRQPAARGGGPTGRGQVFTDRGNPKGQAKVAQLLAGIGGKT